MRARIFIAGVLTIAAACSRPGADPIADPTLDEPGASPELALTSPTGAVPVASDIEMHRAEEPAVPETRTLTAQRTAPEPIPEPVGVAIHQHRAAASERVAVESPDMHPNAEGPDEVEGDPAPGGGKPRGVSTGLGPVPDRTWGDVGIIDDPDPVPGMTGRGGVIIRGGPGSMEDDCKIHPRGGMVADGGLSGGTNGGTSVLVNDRDPRRGALINERAPRTTSRPSVQRGGGLRGGGFPRGGIR